MCFVIFIIIFFIVVKDIFTPDDTQTSFSTEIQRETSYWTMHDEPRPQQRFVDIR